MSNPTFAGEIRNLRHLVNVTSKIKSEMKDIADNPKWSKADRKMARSMEGLFANQEDILRQISSNIANLGIAHSNEPHDEILKALSE